MCAATFIPTLFAIPKIRKQPKCSSVDGWVKKSTAYIYFSVIKKGKSCHFQQHGPWDLKVRQLGPWGSESQAEKDKCHITSSIQRIIGGCQK